MKPGFLTIFFLSVMTLKTVGQEMNLNQCIRYALENNLTPLATNKLFMVIRNLYHKYVYLKDPDSIIGQMQTELSNILLASNPENYDNISYVPSIIFYVFSECQIFKKPPL